MTSETEKPKSRFGRPTKYHEGMPEIAYNILRTGASIVVVASKLDLDSKDTFYEYMKKYPEFSDAVKRGRLHSEAWWEEGGRENLNNKEFNSTLWYMNMKNRFGWKDRTENEVVVSEKEQISELRDELHTCNQK